MTAYNLNNNADDAIVYLPADFIPAPNHVVCARGKSYWEHSGNKRYRAIIAAASQRYSKTSNKLEKSLIVSEIIESIQGENNDGGFVKKEGSRFVLCNQHFTREKISQSLRDGLKDMYRSSTTFKKSRRTRVCQSIHERVERAIRCNRQVTSRMEQLSNDLACAESAATFHTAVVDDDALCNMFSCANADILSAIKADHSLLQQYEQFSQEATAAAQ